MEINTEQPWLNSTGVEVSTEQLKEISQQWDSQTWEAYLSWYESNGNRSADLSELRKPKPWQGAKRKILSDETLQEVSKSWDADTWELFLGSTVDVELSRNETLLDDYQYLIENSADHLFSFQTTLPEKVRLKVQAAIKQLSLLQQKVIDGLYFQELSEREVAKELQVSQPRIHILKKLSLNKIKQLLELDVITAAYLIGGSQNLALKERSRDEQILEVYLEDLKGSYIT